MFWRLAWSLQVMEVRRLSRLPAMTSAVSLQHAPVWLLTTSLKCVDQPPLATHRVQDCDSYVYKVLHGGAPTYLGPFTHVADIPSSGRHCLCSADTRLVVINRGCRSFAVAGPLTWHSLPLTCHHMSLHHRHWIHSASDYKLVISCLTVGSSHTGFSWYLSVKR